MKRLLFAATAAAYVFAAPELAADTKCGSKYSDSTLANLVRQAPGLRTNVLRMAVDAAGCARERGLVKRGNLLTVIDYSIPSTQPRLFVFDLASKKLLFRELVAHGKNSGGNVPDTFSNIHGSLATSLGLFVTDDTYVGSNGYSLRLRGLEKGVNDNAWDRAIVMHGAHYVSSIAIKALGRLGRSWGCPAVRSEVARKLINTIRGGSPIFAYYPDRQWMKTSRFLPKQQQPVKVASAASAE
ncbi:MAG TPA: murein L,D-transpeptidase catalytic domain family protein [Thermoanaerobaculia bacterium]